MKKAIADVAEFHHASDVPSLAVPGFPSDDRIRLRIELIQEEVSETLGAIGRRDIVDVADGIADSCYVLIGTALEFGIPLARVWDAVQASNLTKICKETGKVRRSPTGKILKGESYAPANIAAAMTADLFEDA